MDAPATSKTVGAMSMEDTSPVATPPAATNSRFATAACSNAPDHPVGEAHVSFLYTSSTSSCPASTSWPSTGARVPLIIKISAHCAFATVGSLDQTPSIETVVPAPPVAKV